MEDRSSGKIGYLSAAARHKKKILKEKNPANTNIASQISSFELTANVSELYNLRALKTDELITWQDIDKLEAQARRNLGYARSLRKAQLAHKRDGYVDWATSFVSTKIHTTL